MGFEGKEALITGAAEGIGNVDVRFFADEGRPIEADIAESGGEALFIKLGVTSEDDWACAVDVVVARFGRLDVRVNNAGVWHYGTVEETPADAWDRVMDVNVKVPFLGTQAAIPVMRRNEGGSIINISSVAGLVGNRKPTAYNASKGAVRILTKSALDPVRPGGHPGQPCASRGRFHLDDVRCLPRSRGARG